MDTRNKAEEDESHQAGTSADRGKVRTSRSSRNIFQVHEPLCLTGREVCSAVVWAVRVDWGVSESLWVAFLSQGK